ncbi:MAG: hypothetical protein ACFE68_09290 [Candidatus Hodarchaeota archaeon]
MYRDTVLPCRSPPLASYFLLPPVVLGGGYITAFEIYFSLINVVASVMIYKTLLNRGESFAKNCSIFYAFNPLVIITSTVRVQDECIVALLFILITFFMMRGRYYVAATFLGLGIMTKPVIVLVFPLLIFAEGDIREKIFRGVISIGIALMVLFPFYLFAGEEVFKVFRGYSKAEGTGLLALLTNTHDYSIPVTPFTILFIITYLLASYYVIKKKFNHWFAITLILSVFFITFIKIHASYYLYLIIYASPFVLINKRLLNELLLILPPTLMFLHRAKSDYYEGNLPYLFGGILAWIIVTMIVIHLLVIILKSQNSLAISPFERINKQENLTHILDKKTFILAHIVLSFSLVLLYF